jgi:Acetyltransferase (GNAT) domain
MREVLNLSGSDSGTGSKWGPAMGRTAAPHFSARETESATTAPRSFRVFRGKAGFAAIAHEWKRITDTLSRRRFFHLYEWHRSFLEALGGDDGSLVCFLAYLGGDIEAIFPFQMRKSRRLGITANVLELRSHPHLALRDVVIAEGMDHSGLIKDLIRFTILHPEYRCDIIRMEYVLEESALLEAASMEPKALSIWETMGYCDYLPCRPYEEYRGALSANFRAQLRRSHNRAAKRGGVSYRATRDPQELKRFYQQFLDVEASGWKGAEGSAVRLHENLKAFYANLVEYFSSFGGCEIHLLEVDGAVIAAQFCLVVNDTMYSLKIGYDERWSSLSPGHLLTQYALDRCGKGGEVRWFNLVSDEVWQQPWVPMRYKLYRWHRFNTTVPGLLALVLYHLKRMARRANFFPAARAWSR